MTTTPDNNTIFIVDDDDAIRRALTALLSVKGYVVKSFESAEAFLAALPAKLPGGCALVDVRMAGMSGLDLHREMKRRGIALPVIIITGHGDVPLAVAALKAGVADFIEKPFDSDVILAAIHDALTAIPAPSHLYQDIPSRIARLTPREREVMDLVVKGQPNKVIAHQLQIALRTVEIHRARVMEKTGARNLSELVRLAIRLEDSAP